MDGGNIVVRLSLDDGGYKIATVNAGRLMNELKRTFESTAASVKRLEHHSDSMGRKFRDLVLTLGNLRFVAMDIHDIFLRLPMSMLKTAGELEKMQQLMTGLSKETDKAKARLEGIRDFNFVIGMAKTAPFDIKALSDSFVKLKTAGIDPANGSMKALVDSVARFGGDGETLKRASVAIMQMSGKGVISMEELRQQLGEAVPSAMKSMADGLGMTVAELSDAVGKGMVKAGPALDKMFLRMQVENEGAAAEMMKTWVGMTSRLKTEWDLTAQHVVNSGLGDAAKGAVLAITDTLQTKEFKDFGREFGAGLGEVVTDTLAIAKALIALREEIALGVKVWLAYKAVTSIIAPVGMAISKAMESARNSMAATASEAIKNTKQDRDAAILAASNAKYVTEARAQELRKKLLMDKEELASVRARNAAILAEDRRLAAQLAAMRVAESTRGVNNIGDQQRVLRDMDALSNKNTELLKRQLELQQSLPNTAREFRKAGDEARNKAAEMNRLSGGMTLATGSAMALTGATKALSAASAFLGGPIGVLITAITVLAATWATVTERANEARRAQERAASKTSIEGDEEKLKRFVDEAKRDIDAKRNALTVETVSKGDGTNQRRKKTRQEVEKESQELMRAEERLVEAEANVERARTTIRENGAKTRAQNLLMDTRATFAARTEAGRAEIRLIEEQRDKLEKSAKTEKERKDPKFVKEKADLQARQHAILMKDYDLRIEDLKQKAKEYRAAMEDTPASDKPALAQKKAAAEAYEAELDILRTEREGLAARISSTGALGESKAPKQPKSTAEEKNGLKDLIDKLAVERAQLAAELKGFDDQVTPAADKAQAAYDKVIELWRQGDLDLTKGGKLVKETSENLAKEAAEHARANALMEQKIKDRAKSVKDSEAVRDYINGMMPSYQDALQLLLNPLDTAKMGSKERTVEKWIAENGDKIRSHAQETRQTTDAVIANIRKMANVEDAGKLNAEMARDTKQMNDAIVNDSRDAARARAAAEDERFRKEMQNIIDGLKARGVAATEIAAIEKGLEENTAARATKLALDFKSPMDRMVSNWQNAAKNMEEATTGWANKTMDSMTELVMTGKTDFRSLANSIIADIVRINLQKALANTISGATSWLSTTFMFADGGVMTEAGSVPLKKYAAGGIARSPQLAMFGEGSMPEAYVPLPDGRTIPVTLASNGKGAASGDQNVQINITVHKDGKTTENSSGDDRQSYRQLGERIKSVVREELTAQKRPGGILY